MTPEDRRRDAVGHRDEFDAHVRRLAEHLAGLLPDDPDLNGTVTIPVHVVTTVRAVVEAVVDQVGRYHERLKALEDAAGTTTTRRISEDNV